MAACQLEATAADDSTPVDEIGFRLRLVAGFVPRGFDDGPRDLEGPQLRVFVANADRDLDFELGIAAIDASGNVGPETVVPIVDTTGCTAGGLAGLPVGLVVIGIGRRRRRLARA
jgi:hypothetical protein